MQSLPGQFGYFQRYKLTDMGGLFFAKNILPNSIWVTGLHSHFAKTNKEAPLSFSKYSPENFEDFASVAFERARQLGLSAWAITDYTFDPVRWAKSIYPNKNLDECTQIWEEVAQKSAMEQTIDGQFLALSGFEYGKSINYEDLSGEEKVIHSGKENYKRHIDWYGDLVIHNASFIAPEQGLHDIKNVRELHEVYEYLKLNKGIGIFAHPKDREEGGKGNNFNSLALDRIGLDSMVGFEIWNGAMAVSKKGIDFFEEYVSALEKGWRVGAMYNPDNMWPNWGDVTCQGYPLGFTIVLPPSSLSGVSLLNRANLFTQLRGRKFYGSLSPKLLLGMYTETGETMGDEFAISKPTTLFIKVSGEAVSSIRIHSGIVGQHTPNSVTKEYQYKTDHLLEFKIDLPAFNETAFYFVELINGEINKWSENKFIAHSSPIWVRRTQRSS